MKTFINQLQFRNPYPNLKLEVTNLKSSSFSSSSQQTSYTAQSKENT